MSKHKITSFLFEDIDDDELAYNFSYMSKQGWYFVGFDQKYKYDKGNKPLEYAVVSYDESCESKEDFIKYYEENGWSFIDCKDCHCVFVKTRDDAIEIISYEKKYNVIKENLATEMSSLSLNIVFIAIGITFIRKEFFGMIFDKLGIYLLLLFLWMILSFIVNTVFKILEYRKFNKYNVNDENVKQIINEKWMKNIEFKKIYVIEIIIGFCIVLLGAFSIDLIIGVFILLWMCMNALFIYLISKYINKHPSYMKHIIRNLILTFVICIVINVGYVDLGFNALENLDFPEFTDVVETGDEDGTEVIDYPEGTPFKLEELGLEDQLIYTSYDEFKSLFGCKYDYEYDYINRYYLSYTLYKCVNTFVADGVYKDLYKTDKEDNEIERVFENGYQDTMDDYTFHTKNIVMKVWISEELSEKQIKVIQDFMEQEAK